MFDLGKVVDGVLVEGHFSESAERDFTLWPNFGQVKDVPAELLGLFGGEDLDITSPAGEIARLDLVKEILRGIVGVFATEFARGIVVEGLDALIDLEVELDIVEVAVLLDQF